MKRWFTTFAAIAVCSAALHADVTIVQTTTIEGGMMAASGQVMQPKTTNRIKGNKSRTDLDASMIQVTTIADLDSHQVIVLRPDQKTAQIVKPGEAAGGNASAAASAAAATAASADGSIKPTGNTQVIDGMKCDEYTFTMSMNMSEMNNPAMPPEASAMMQGVKVTMKGSLWVAKDAPGVAEFMKYQKAAASTDIASIVSGASGMRMPGMDKLMKAMGGLNGMPYLTEMTMTMEGGSGQMAEMLQQAGAMKITTKVTSITTDPIGDDVFKVPEGYTVIKQ
jgi:hypothetical protein